MEGEREERDGGEREMEGERDIYTPGILTLTHTHTNSHTNTHTHAHKHTHTHTHSHTYSHTLT